MEVIEGLKGRIGEPRPAGYDLTDGSTIGLYGMRNIIVQAGYELDRARVSGWLTGADRAFLVKQAKRERGRVSGVRMLDDVMILTVTMPHITVEVWSWRDDRDAR